jgi:CheY-like chemotaxis protein
MKILLVDDDAFLRDMYATKFGEDGHMVQSAETGSAALDAMRGEQFDVVLMDVIMPGMTGVELLEQIKLEKLDYSPVCIILSNQGEKHDIDAALAAGARGYIIKAEMIPSEVVAKVKSIVGTP